MNGIIIDGNVYEAVEDKKPWLCDRCDLRSRCKDIDTDYDVDIETICVQIFGEETRLSFSQKLTDKLNKD